MMEVEVSAMFKNFELPFVPFVLAVFGTLLMVGVLLCVSHDGAAEVQNQWPGFDGVMVDELVRAETVCPGTRRNSSLQD
jgi:hypothetical protein